MLAEITTVGLRGVESYRVRVEVSLDPGLPCFTVVGLPAGAVREGRDRVMAALRNGGFSLPPRRVTVNLAPAAVPKSGSAYDVPIAVGLLVGAGVLPPDAVDGTAFVGELGLDGTLRPVPGVLPMAAGIADSGVARIVVPRDNAREADLVEGLEVVPARDLGSLVALLNGTVPTETAADLRCSTRDSDRVSSVDPGCLPDLADVRGQEQAKRVLEIAAAGGHNLLLMGPPGSGKTMLARRLPGILPRLSFPEALEVTKVHSVAGRLAGGTLMERPPFRAPHHTTSRGGLIGGGSPPGPGEVSLAHHGVLFLDELPEFRRGVLESLRQPLEDGFLHLSRARFSVRYPSRFILVAAMNPCPCGHRGDGSDRCMCEPAAVGRYQGRISGPLLDRMDLHLSVPPVRVDLLGSESSGECSAPVRARVERARETQRRRLASTNGIYANGQMGPDELRVFCRTASPVTRVLRRAVETLELSARAFHRILKVARTVADLEGSEEIGEPHVAEAIQYRQLDRKRVV